MAVFTPWLSSGHRCVEWMQTERVSICVGGCENTKPNETWSSGEIPHSSQSPPLAPLLSARAQTHRHSLCSTWEACVCFREKPANKYKWLQQPNTERATPIPLHQNDLSPQPTHVNHSEQTMAMIASKSRQTHPLKEVEHNGRVERWNESGKCF